MRERWRSISDSLKVVFVTLARFEQEADHYQAVQAYYQERIQTARDHSQLLQQAKKPKRLSCFEAMTSPNNSLANSTTASL